MPNLPPDGVDDVVSKGVEMVSPILRPLLVHVIDAALTRYGSGEHDDGTERNQLTHELPGGTGGKMFCHFQAYGQIKGTSNAQRHSQIFCRKPVSRNLEQFT